MYINLKFTAFSEEFNMRNPNCISN